MRGRCPTKGRGDAGPGTIVALAMTILLHRQSSRPNSGWREEEVRAAMGHRGDYMHTPAGCRSVRLRSFAAVAHYKDPSN